MKPQLPQPSDCFRAIDIYLQHAYEQEPTTTVKSQVATLRGWPGNPYEAPVFARTGQPVVQRYSMRLGNRHYPHMKLALELAPDGFRYLFKADTHDRHVSPPEGSSEQAAFLELRRMNQQIAERIENAWVEAGLATFKSFLQQDIARRAGGSS